MGYVLPIPEGPSKAIAWQYGWKCDLQFRIQGEGTGGFGSPKYDRIDRKKTPVRRGKPLTSCGMDECGITHR
jgi:hypothetical protein